MLCDRTAILSRFLTKAPYDFSRLKYYAHYVEMVAHSARSKRNIFAHFTRMWRNSLARNWSTVVLWRFPRVLLPEERVPEVQIESEIHMRENFCASVVEIEAINQSSN